MTWKNRVAKEPHIGMVTCHWPWQNMLSFDTPCPSFWRSTRRMVSGYPQIGSVFCVLWKRKFPKTEHSGEKLNIRTDGWFPNLKYSKLAMKRIQHVAATPHSKRCLHLWWGIELHTAPLFRRWYCVTMSGRFFFPTASPTLTFRKRGSVSWK